ncbi:MAG: hypothetical protein QOI41_7694 [Myxococcales bacterium]|nr:hypothetical protein [Myxococcales bacterium]
MNLTRTLGVFLMAGALATACSDSAGSKPSTTTTPSDGGIDDAGDTFTSSEQLAVTVPATGRVFVKLASPPAVVTPADPKTDKSWDLAFEGLDVFTNGGPSGPGNAAAFGPNDSIVFLGDTAPTPPFLSADTTGGAFIRWWYYGGAAANHALYTRFHVYGIKDGAKYYKVQVLDYYGLRSGAPTAALYRVRWAEVTATGIGPIHDLADLDGTAGGTTANPNVKSECLDLGTSARTMFTPAEARASSAWHLCFRREDISVNGEVGGPRGVGAVDLDAASSPNDKLSDVVQKTPESEQARFDAVNAASLSDQPFRGDRVVSAFGTLWLELGANPVAPSKTAWLVQGADGTSKYLVGFARFDGATATSPGTIAMRVKSVK